jgi:hypothetical protein
VFFFHPSLIYSEFLKRNEDALFIRVVGERQTPTTCYFILSNTCIGGHHGVLLYFYRTPAMAEDKHQPRRVTLFYRTPALSETECWQPLSNLKLIEMI